MINNEIIKLKFDNSFNGRLFAVQGDTGRVFNLQVFDDFSKPVDVTGMKLRMYVANSKEVSYSEGEVVEATEGKIKVQVYNSQLKYPGKQKAQFIITDKDGQKIGSKIFDLWVEEGLEACPSLGKNIYVDFEKIDETLNLIKDYDKTLEEAKEVDASLKVGINEGIEARNNLAECKKKALEIKGQLDTSKVDANKTLEDLKTTKTESETLKSNLTSENQKATENIKDLTNKIDTGKTASNELNASIEDAKTNKSNLDASNTNALATKKTLEDATNTANTTKTELGNLKNQGDTLSGDLTAKITEGSNLKSNLDTSTSNALSVKNNLDEGITNATSTSTTLKATDDEAKKTEAIIRDLMNQLNLTKDEVQKIIVNGKLDQYVTEPRLKEALEAIDVTSQLDGYAKKEDVGVKVVWTTKAEQRQRIKDGTAEPETLYLVTER
jgi:chromosome segregation ATPase